MDVVLANPRGVGFGSGTSLVTGEPVSHGPDLSMFVASRADAYRIVDWATPSLEALREAAPDADYHKVRRTDRAFVDYRTFEPGWLQVKFVVEAEHKPVLERLCEALMLRDGLLTKRLIDWAIDPMNNWDVAKGFQALHREALEAMRKDS